MGREMGGSFKREETHVYLWLIHVEVWQKTTKFCKAIILKLKNKFKKIVKYLGINLTKEVKNAYLENYKTLMKEIGDNTNSWKDNTVFMDGKNQHC